ncbi:MAG: apolipoprotein N-acyltransferase, partial [Pseudomonadota bacterium]
MDSAAAAGASWPGAARRAEGLGRGASALAAALSGVVLAASQPPLGFWPALFLSGPALLWLWRASSGGRTFLIGWAAGCGFFAATLHWIVEPFLVDVAAHGWMAPFALVGLSGGLALFWGAGFRAAAWLHARFGAAHGLAGAAALTLGWAAAEFARSYVLTGFPWALPVYAWTETPVAQTASAIGPYGLSLLTLLAALAAGAALGPSPIGRAAPPVLAAALVAGAWGWGAARLADAAPPPDDAPLIRILQTAVPQAIKWEPDRQAENFAMLLDLTAPPGATPPAVAIWPETAVTFVLDESPEALAILGDRLRGVPAAIGSLRRDGRGETARWRNSLFLFDGVGGLGAPFDKIHLVPFGEYTPLYG